MIIDGLEFNDKQSIRAYLKKKRSSMTFERILIYSEEILRKLIELDEYKEADEVLTYISFSSEVDTHFLIKKILNDGKKIAAPRVLNKEKMEFFYFNDLSELKASDWGILEPDENEANKVVLDKNKKYIIILPGVGFDESLTRLGYGGGFYDRYLKINENQNLTKVMLAYESEKTEENLPKEEFDIPADVILTELNIYR